MRRSSPRKGEAPTVAAGGASGGETTLRGSFASENTAPRGSAQSRAQTVPGGPSLQFVSFMNSLACQQHLATAASSAASLAEEIRKARRGHRLDLGMLELSLLAIAEEADRASADQIVVRHRFDITGIAEEVCHG